jgi:hypothetical protein
MKLIREGDQFVRNVDSHLVTGSVAFQKNGILDYTAVKTTNPRKTVSSTILQ